MFKQILIALDFQRLLLALHGVLHTLLHRTPRNIPEHTPTTSNNQQHALQTDLLK